MGNRKSSAKGSFVQSKKLPEMEIEIKEEYREYKIMVIWTSVEELSVSLAKSFPNTKVVRGLEAKEYHFDKEKLKEMDAIIYHGGNTYTKSVQEPNLNKIFVLFS